VSLLRLRQPFYKIYPASASGVERASWMHMHVEMQPQESSSGLPWRGPPTQTNH